MKIKLEGYHIEFMLYIFVIIIAFILVYKTLFSNNINNINLNNKKDYK